MTCPTGITRFPLVLRTSPTARQLQVAPGTWRVMRHLLCGIVAWGLGWSEHVQLGVTRASDVHFSFQSDQLDQNPQKFIFCSGRTSNVIPVHWRVVADTENSQRQVLAWLAPEKVEHRYALALAESCHCRDVKLSVRIKFPSGEPDATGGLVWRYQDSENYLVARLDPSQQRGRLYRVVNGNLATFGHADGLTLQPETWYTLRVEHKRDTVKMYLDDEALLVVKDRHFRHSGRVGIWTKTTASTYFDDLRIRQWHDDDRENR
jgi:hypothetical protein